MTHRLFVGIRPPVEIRDILIDLMEDVEGARWQDDDQLHLTLRYIGEVDRHLANDLADGLGRIEFAPFDLQIESTGYFERKGVPHTLWAGVGRNDKLRALQQRIERVCVSNGLEPTHRKFHPHITLARLNRSSGPIAAFLARTANLRLTDWQVESYILYESHLRPSGSIYEEIVRFPLGPEQ